MGAIWGSIMERNWLNGSHMRLEEESAAFWIHKDRVRKTGTFLSVYCTILLIAMRRSVELSHAAGRRNVGVKNLLKLELTAFL